MKLTLIARSEAGGKGRVQWTTTDQENFPETDQSVTYELSAGKIWQKITLDLPIKGQPQIVRLYLPAQTIPPVEVQSIRFRDIKGREKVWDFTEVSP